MVDFTSILSKKVSEVEKPKPRPVGTYMASVMGMAQQKVANTRDGERAVLSFKVKLISPQGDVDADDLKAHGEISTWAPINYDFWVDTPEGEWQLRQFLSNTLGLEAGKNESMGEMVAQTPGRQFNAHLRHRPYTDKNNQPQIASEIDAVAAL